MNPGTSEPPLIDAHPIEIGSTPVSVVVYIPLINHPTLILAAREASLG
jgi:hypothetical protein